MSNPNVFTPVVDADEVYGEGDWRPILSAKQRDNNYRLYMIGKSSIDNRLEGVLLPSFDFSLSLDDKSFGSSIAPCWTNVPDTKHHPRDFVPNAFALPILMYPYLGEKKEHWISPWNRRNMIGADQTDPEEFADAFDDLNKWVRRNKNISQEDKDLLLKAPSMKEDPAIPGRTIRYFSLALCTEKEAREPHLGLVGYTATSYSYLLEQMRWRHEDDGEPRDPDFPRYLLGDPTNPKAALRFHCDKLLLDAKDTHETNVMCFTKRREYLDDPVDTVQVDDATLAKRFLLPDPENWNIPTYEEQVMHMIEHFDSRVTIEMIQAACGHRYRGEIPSERPKSVTYSAPGTSQQQPETQSRGATRETAQEQDPVAAVTGGGLAPTSTAPIPQPEEPAPPVQNEQPPAVDNTQYWVGAPNSNSPSKMTAAELQVAFDAGQVDGFKVLVGKDWKLVADSGLVTVPEPAPSVPSDDAPPSVPAGEDAPPSVPSDDAPPSVPAGDAAPPAEGGMTRDQLKDKLFPDAAAFASLPADKQAEAEKLVDDAYAATDGGKHQDMPGDVVERLLAIIG